METCSTIFEKDMNKNVPRDVVSYEGDANSPVKCSLKCFYFYNYTSSSSCVVVNDTTMLSVKYDGTGDITYNTATYTPAQIRIFAPSIHKYNGQQALAEIVIEHVSKAASMAGLLVCIPLISTGRKSSASEMLEKIIAGSPEEPNVSESVQVADFNLNRVIPTAPFYTYSGPLPYKACAPDSIYQYVVFHPARNGAITLDDTAFESLSKLISYSYIVATKGTDVFYNPKGTASNGFNGDDQIYIQCNPAGESAEQEIYKEPAAESSALGVDTAAAQEAAMKFIYVILGVVIIYISFLIMKKIVEFVSNPPKTIEIT